MQQFLTKDEELAITREIAAVELQSRGEVRVVVTSKWIINAEHYAWKLFRKLGLDRTREHNAALILVAVRQRRFAVIGDAGLNTVVAADYWHAIADAMAHHLRNGSRGEAILTGVRLLGATLAEHWPAAGANPDELPNEIVYE